jgi:hypothetical protein
MSQVVLHWSFNDFVQGAQNPIEDWHINDLTDAGRFQSNSLLKNTATTENHLQWGGFEFLEGESRKLRIWELKFFADNKQYRLLGVFGSLRKQAILLVGCSHKGKVYVPANALKTAIKRAKALRDGKAGYIGRKIRLDI